MHQFVIFILFTTFVHNSRQLKDWHIQATWLPSDNEITKSIFVIEKIRKFIKISLVSVSNDYNESH